MEFGSSFEAICRAMERPGFYRHPVRRLQRIDTHISTVFLTGDWVYKLKKPVDFGFLDFRELEARRRFCEQEVRLNQRLSRGVYDGVVEIRLDDSGALSLGGPGEVVEYAVRMRQLPRSANLVPLLENRKVAGAEMQTLGEKLAAFYALSRRNPEIDRYGSPEVVGFNTEENFRQVAPFVGNWVEAERWEFIREVSRTFFSNHRELFERRVLEGRIRDGHGDLRAEHIYFDRGVQIIDCIEFNDRFRYGDAAADLAFLHMDLERMGRSDLSGALLAAYVGKSEDGGLYALIDFYAAYRSIVKLKVACLRSTETDSEEELRDLRSAVAEYLGHAYRYAVQFGRPALWVFCGLPASGKSYLAEETARALSLRLFQSDRIRKELAGLPEDREEVVPYNRGLYRQELRGRVYGHMLALAQEQLKNGRSAALDASFSRRRWREEASRLAADLDTNVFFIECICSEERLRERLAARETGHGASDARLQHLPRMIREFEPLEEASPDARLKIDTERPRSESMVELLSGAYRLKRLQVARKLQAM
ncbi:MAG: AAA family ATPase [Syntrophobacteraceae bacterium]|nr:AAA family ATPase [Desulfobacteraceae bacterium]